MNGFQGRNDTRLKKDAFVTVFRHAAEDRSFQQGAMQRKPRSPQTRFQTPSPICTAIIASPPTASSNGSYFFSKIQRDQRCNSPSLYSPHVVLCNWCKFKSTHAVTQHMNWTAEKTSHGAIHTRNQRATSPLKKDKVLIPGDKVKKVRPGVLLPGDKADKVRPGFTSRHQCKTRGFTSRGQVKSAGFTSWRQAKTADFVSRRQAETGGFTSRRQSEKAMTGDFLSRRQCE